MDFGGIFPNIMALFQDHIAIAVMIAAGLCLLFYFRPKPMFKLAATLAVFLVVFYFFSLFMGMTSTGYSQKVKMVNDVPENNYSSPASEKK